MARHGGPNGLVEPPDAGWVDAGWVDVSRPLVPGIPVWPGDVPFRLEQAVSDDGAVLSFFAATCHLGTHIDAPMHLDCELPGVEEIALGRLIGPAEVVAVAVAPGSVAPASLPDGWTPAAPRLLIRTDSHPLGAPIGPGFSALESELVHWLADRGVVLVGIDTPSVDPFESEDLPAHRALLERGLTWIEGLWLGDATPGLYQLVALPMALVGAEAAPVRAVLRREF